jgi:DNA repair protein RecN (Recombination protein N)
MLTELTVKGFGIIEAITWEPAARLNVITGETGAGKSLVVDAVEALLSGQVQEEDIRYGAEAAQIEGIFQIPHYQAMAPLRGLLAEKGLEAEENTILVSGDFRRQGRATPRINRQAVARSLLRDIGAYLVDIHGQSAHLSILNPGQHLDFLDAYAHTGELRHNFGELAAALYQAERELQMLQRSERELSKQAELLNFQIDEIKRAGLKVGEEETLARELARLGAAEKLKAAAYAIYGIIYGDEGTSAPPAALDRLNEVLPLLKQAIATDPFLQPQLEYLEGAASGLAEMARDIRAYGDKLDYDPRHLEEVQNRLELIRDLKRKYGGSIGEVLAYLNKAEGELKGLTHAGERCAQLEADIGQMKKEMGKLAAKLSAKRSQAAQKLTRAVKKELAELNMARVDFSVSLTREASPEGIPFPDGERCKFSSSGADSAEFMTSTNPGEPLKPLAKIASAGEISRFMLALKVALAEADTIPVLIFDEIDIGIGGRSGEVIGRKLWKLSRQHQVICVTHLPQIAAFADAHYRVSKQSAGNRTTSTITALQGEARLKELAVMLAGARYTETALTAARELLQKAEAWKEGAA